ncbi:hypothetical protein CDEST_11682 [Colletotrichum destructivum]|uniref:Uncharacterized protein n=1 Tax=Colletotrichum destructivum TaxID=34406 RepID=A0AAX4ITX3_9PEZI|nr:hypothetical protein CDEST_11682 [Colletotrichum destructivum]
MQSIPSLPLFSNCHQAVRKTLISPTARSPCRRSTIAMQVSALGQGTRHDFRLHAILMPAFPASKRRVWWRWSSARINSLSSPTAGPLLGQPRPS